MKYGVTGNPVTWRRAGSTPAARITSAESSFGTNQPSQPGRHQTELMLIESVTMLKWGVLKAPSLSSFLNIAAYAGNVLQIATGRSSARTLSCILTWGASILMPVVMKAGRSMNA